MKVIYSILLLLALSYPSFAKDDYIYCIDGKVYDKAQGQLLPVFVEEERRVQIMVWVRGRMEPQDYFMMPILVQKKCGGKNNEHW